MRHGFLVACVVIALLASGTLLYVGDMRGAVAAALVAASALIFLGAKSGDPRFRQRYWLGIALLAGGLAMLGFPVGVVAGALAALFVLQIVLNAFVARRIGQITLERLDQPEVMPGAEDFVQGFSAEGFRVCGSYRFHIGGRRVVLTVMAGPHNERLAVVTDKVLQISSRFGRRWIVTTSSAASPVPVDVLRQYVAGGPSQLVRAHDTALTLLSRHSFRPDVFANDVEALQAVREMEERALAFIGNLSLQNAMRMETEGAPRSGMLGHDAHSLSRINSWMSA
jgi:hypothetical protein